MLLALKPESGEYPLSLVRGTLSTPFDTILEGKKRSVNLDKIPQMSRNFSYFQRNFLEDEMLLRREKEAEKRKGFEQS